MLPRGVSAAIWEVETCEGYVGEYVSFSPAIELANVVKGATWSVKSTPANVRADLAFLRARTREASRKLSDLLHRRRVETSILQKFLGSCWIAGVEEFFVKEPWRFHSSRTEPAAAEEDTREK